MNTATRYADSVFADAMRANSHCRPRAHLKVAGHFYPTAWRQTDMFRADRGVDLPNWPDWCFLPLAAAYSIVCADAGMLTLPLHLVSDVAWLGALAAWRVTQGIYRFDPAVYDAVRQTAASGDIPCEVLYQLPEWCVYIETPDMNWGGDALHGVWAHLEWDANSERTELRLLADLDCGLVPFILNLGAWSLSEAIARAFGEARHNLGSVPGIAFSGELDKLADARSSLHAVVEPILSLLLYLCSQAGEIGDGKRRPLNRVPLRIQRGTRLFAPARPTMWNVGVRMGAALRRSVQAQEAGIGGGHTGPRAHIRRAHWHGFRSGPTRRSDGTEIPTAERKFDLRWLPPIPVNVGDAGDLPATVRVVT